MQRIESGYHHLKESIRSKFSIEVATKDRFIELARREQVLKVTLTPDMKRDITMIGGTGGSWTSGGGVTIVHGYEFGATYLGTGLRKRVSLFLPYRYLHAEDLPKNAFERDNTFSLYRNGSIRDAVGDSAQFERALPHVHFAMKIFEGELTPQEYLRAVQDGLLPRAGRD
ncbi:MAG: hypothetical protein HYV40_02465 [Candidatus Levybacteria bacterium]|nr:hypothetical protein [Candidatus Levybacteria bacterium]